MMKVLIIINRIVQHRGLGFLNRQIKTSKSILSAKSKLSSSGTEESSAGQSSRKEAYKINFTKNADPDMTSLKGEFPITYAELVEIFGKPDIGPYADLDKSSCEWALQFEDGTVATIYDYKMGRQTPMSEYKWHIGGHTAEAMVRVRECIVQHRFRMMR